MGEYRETRQQRRQRERQEQKASRGPLLESVRDIQPNDDVCMQPGWCATEADLPAARKQTHDTLIRSLGARRRSGVAWVQETGGRAVLLVDQLAEGETSALVANYCGELHAKLADHGGWIVVAYAKADR